MRRVAPDAGSRRGFLKAGAALLAGQWAASGRAEKPRASHWQPLFSVTGARLATRSDPSGGILPQSLGAFVPLIFPVSVAAALNDIYIADAGTTHLYRYDRALDAFAVIRGARVDMTTRLRTGPDGSIYVLDTFASLILRFTRGGAPLSALRAARSTSRYIDFVVHPLTSKVYAVDAAHLSVDVIEPLGGVAIERFRIDEPGPIAMTPQGFYLAGQSCGCVTEWRDGQEARRLGAGQLFQLRALAIVGSQLYGIDGERNIVLIHEEGADRIAPQTMGLLSPESLAAAPGMLLIADGAGRRVAAFRNPAEAA